MSPFQTGPRSMAVQRSFEKLLWVVAGIDDAMDLADQLLAGVFGNLADPR